MNKKICIFWLWFQGRQYLKYFLKNNYEVVWVCRTIETKENIEREFWINVVTNYKNVLDNNIDLLVLSVYPIDIYEELFEYSENYNYDILSDLPLTFNSYLLNKYLSNERLFLMLMESKLDFFNFFVKNNLDKIHYAKCLILQNKDNLLKQKYKKESLIVDTHYVLNNLLWLPENKININYKFIDRNIKNIEYIIELFLINWEKVIFRYEEWKWQIFCINSKWEVYYKNIKRIIVDDIMNLIISDIKEKNRNYIEDYYNNFIYIIKKFNYEKII